MIRRIKTKNLFGRFNYDLDFSNKKMSIITGPNGFGKTTLLRIIRNILDDDLFDLYKIPFEEVELETHDNKKLLFKKENGSFLLNGERIIIPLSINDASPTNIMFSLRTEDLNILSNQNRRFVLTQQILTVPSVGSSDLSITAESQDYIVRINAQVLGKNKLKFVDDLLSFYSSVGNTIFCGADRLYREYLINDGGRNKRKLSDVIGSLTSKLNDIFNYYNEEYTSLSNYLDYSFISSLVSEIDLSTDKKVYTEQMYIGDTKFIKNKLDKLIEYGFLSKDKYYADKISFKEKYNLVFKVFTRNYKHKISALEDLINKLDLFSQIVNSKLINKQIQIKRDKNGSNIIVKDNDNIIPLQSLSSGEQEIIVLYFKLIFELDDQLIALIDEPELSSHVSWQYDMLDDFENILKLNKNVSQMIICTHSPQVINERWEKTIDLFEMSNKQ